MYHTATRARAAILLSIAFCVPSFLLSACGKKRILVWQAERTASIGGEFIRLYDDGNAEYGYGVVSEKLKAKGAYRHSQDTLHLLGASFKPHFPDGYLLVREGVVIMEGGLHFLVTQSREVP